MSLKYFMVPANLSFESSRSTLTLLRGSRHVFENIGLKYRATRNHRLDRIPQSIFKSHLIR